jgi:hypothetical protein
MIETMVSGLLCVLSLVVPLIGQPVAFVQPGSEQPPAEEVTGASRACITRPFASG